MSSRRDVFWRVRDAWSRLRNRATPVVTYPSADDPLEIVQSFPDFLYFVVFEGAR